MRLYIELLARVCAVVLHVHEQAKVAEEVSTQHRLLHVSYDENSSEGVS